MTPERCLLLVGATDETVAKAKELGLDVLLLQHPTKVNTDQQRLADHVEVVDYTRWDLVEPIAERLRDTPGFAAAVSITEPGLENAARINDLFALGGTGHEVTRRLRDKAVMREHLAGLDPDDVHARPLRERADLDAFGERHGYPFIVKPTDATASIGVHRLDGPADADRVWAEVRRLAGTRTDRVSTLLLLQDFLMEEYLDGPEYSVESFSSAGRHVVIAVTEKFTDPAHFAELGHAVPARLGAAVEERVRGAVIAFLDRIGIKDGVCHTEIRIDAHGPRVIESHNRIAGDAITDLVHSVYGIDTVKLALGAPFGLADELPDRPEAHGGAAVRSVVGRPGDIVESVDGVAEAEALDEVLAVRISAKPGETVRPLRDNWDRLGLVAATGEDTTAAIRRGAELIGTVVKVRLKDPDGRPGLAEAAPVSDRTVMSA
ncbi:ATP-grasp domain-containing protein [Streptomyces cupreus]|uniref:ATP-grasp domain-containing protein n=1 Tax=Streptomyces cupreus TaxID=2759956 RepID=A0A7X1J4V1_9ACTN|nr:ATP-grasp domain-containing protein [Streptomyces cupreus]MBC2904256.1 ATP-grasp domain-containing protein [Streptomyces cupreus]